jgi:rod shape-determining protein MreD
MGADAMNWLKSIIILVAAFAAVFLQAAVHGPRNFLGAQIDLLPAIVVYASLSSDFVTVVLVAVLGGLCFDSLSVNPLGISILPLFVVGFFIYPRRGLILRDEFYARFVLGLGASAIVPLLTLLLLLSTHHAPLVGWGTLWILIVMSMGGGLLTPVCFWLFDAFTRALSYLPVAESSFRPDREIRRGRN